MKSATPPLQKSLVSIAMGLTSLVVCCPRHVTASTVIFGDTLAGGVGYTWTVNMSGTDTATFSHHVGAWSWEDDLLSSGGNPLGWTHTSEWVALTLTQVTTLTMRLERDANVLLPTPLNPANLAPTAAMFPSFTIWRGLDNDGTDDHTFNNDGAISWAEDLTYLGHVNNSTEAFAQATWPLPAGQYTIVVGSNGPSDASSRQGFRATLTAVPEPGAAALVLAGFSLPLFLRRRKPNSPGQAKCQSTHTSINPTNQ